MVKFTIGASFSNLIESTCSERNALYDCLMIIRNFFQEQTDQNIQGTTCGPVGSINQPLNGTHKIKNKTKNQTKPNLFFNK